MSAKLKIKWIGSLILAAALLWLAMVGGKWGISYAAEAGINVAPHIDAIYPSAVAAGSPDTIMIISGTNFGNMSDTRVRLYGIGVDLFLTPKQVFSTGISVNITDTLLTDPILYIVTVVKSNIQTVPTLPITPHDEVSNQVNFTVFEPKFIYLPYISRR